MRRFLKRVIILGVVLAIPLVGYLWHYHTLSKNLMTQHGINGEQANAFKHAYAAAQLFQALSSFLPDDDAEAVVLWLGHMNEYGEQWMHSIPRKRKPDDQPDTTIEMMKDFHNNRAGVAAARWQAKNLRENFPTMDVILRLSATDAITVWANKLPIAQSELDSHVRDVEFANTWAEERAEEIVKRAHDTLETIY